MMARRMRARWAAAVAVWLAMNAWTTIVSAHAGPPYPIVSDRVAGAYVVSIWSDPDSTSDGVAAGRFWVVLSRTSGDGVVPGETRATVSVRPLDRPGPHRTGRAEAVDGNVGRQFVALLLDHEGPFAVHVRVDGSLGSAEVEGTFEATDDLRPSPLMVAVYALPFVALGLLWMKVLRQRRQHQQRRTPAR
jgi:hypothetical protein